MSELSIMQLMRDLRTNLESVGYVRNPDPPELVESIRRHVARALSDPREWASALSDFSTHQWALGTENKLQHACFDALIAGDTAQFGNLLARTLRKEVSDNAEQVARDEWDKAHP